MDLVDRLAGLRFRAGWRAVFFLPAITTLVAYAVVFQVLLRTDGGLANQLLQALGAGPVDWLDSPTWARISLIGSVTWRWTGYNTVILLAGLQAIGRHGWDEDARRAVERLLATAAGLAGDGPLRENYDPLTGEGRNSANFSWSAALLLPLLRT
ncbi:hypothetical protein ACFZDG_32170 [Kitasatospora xanthocidica]|uniref:carbohydrate ABC transporter permease n=1 Tax=Kitasatospora xanthocidica TaxID=83382 RepID=UPI0036E4DC6F